MKNILITGANSFLGKNYRKLSVNTEIDEVCLLENKPENISFKGFDTVIHVAAIVHQTTKISEEKYFEVNTDLAVKVAKQAKSKGIAQFVFISTVKVYGDYTPSKGVWREESDCNPNDSYGKSKYSAEQELLKLNDDSFVVSIVRPPLIYGPGVKANMLSIIKLIDRFPLLPLKGIENKRSFTSINNLIQLIDTVIEKRKSGIFLAMDEKPLSTSELSQIIRKHLNKKVIFFELPGFVVCIGNILIPSIFDRLFGSFEIDNSKTCQTLDYTPNLSTDEGIKIMVEDYLASKSK